MLLSLSEAARRAECSFLRCADPPAAAEPIAALHVAVLGLAGLPD